MNIKHTPLPLMLAFCLIFSAGLVLMIWLTPTTYAGGDLPDRATPTPVGGGSAASDSNDGRDNDGGEPSGAYISLSASVGSWAVVEWQGSDGRWHPVEGWQGSLSNGSRQWWVAPKDFGTGPFRWVVQQGPDGTIVGMSEPFHLPQQAHNVLRVVAAAK